eukprot:sb/3468915/
MHCEFLEKLLVLYVIIAFTPLVIQSVNTCWKQGPSSNLVNCTSDEPACAVIDCSGQDDVCYYSYNNVSDDEARGCLGREFCFGLVNETWEKCEIPTGTSENQCLHCCQTDNCNGPQFLDWPEPDVVTTKDPSEGATNTTGNQTVAIPMVYIYAGAGGGTLLLLIIAALIIYCVLEIARKKRLKNVIAAINARREQRKNMSIFERAGETVADTTGGILKGIGGIFGFGGDTKPVVVEEEEGKGKK